MEIWLLKLAELWIEPGTKKRLMRVGMLAEALAKRGHAVTWFNSLFDHDQHSYRDLAGDQSQASDRILIKGLRGYPYQKSRSLQRLRHDWEASRAFRQLAEQRRSLPDVIYCSWPTIDMAWQAVRFGRANNVPIVIDIRDLWPEVVVEVAPKRMRWLARLMLTPYYAVAKKSLRRSTVVIGITDQMLQWALDFAGRPCGPWDRTFPLGYPLEQGVSPDSEAERFWEAHGVHGGPRQFVACYPGVLSRRLDLRTLIDAARLLKQQGRDDFKLVICGKGDQEDELRAQSADLDNVMLPGFVAYPVLKALMSRCSVGLVPYPSHFDFVRNLPNKFFEYLAEGLPIVSCLEGEVKRYIIDYDCGVMYKLGDPQDLVRALRSLLDDPTRRAVMSLNARALAPSFDAAHIYDELGAHLEAIARTYQDRETGGLRAARS